MFETLGYRIYTAEWGLYLTGGDPEKAGCIPDFVPEIFRM